MKNKIYQEHIIKVQWNKSKIKRLLTVALIGSLLAVCAGKIVRQVQLQQSLSEKVLRFHIRANSNSEEDQELKLKVRNAVGAYMEQQLDRSAGISESVEIVEEHLEQIEQVAANEIAAQGYTYEAEAFIDETWFPEKTYGTMTFPQGTYEALQVEIGEGKGRNWWCVMYPNLCFEGSVYRVDEKKEQTLEKVLDEKEYKMVMQEKNYEVAFKYLTFLNRVE